MPTPVRTPVPWLGVLAILVTLAAALAWHTPRAAAEVGAIEAPTTALAPGDETTLTISADDGDGDLRIVASDGTLGAPACGGTACVGVNGVGGGSLQILDEGNTLATVSVPFTAPSMGPAVVTIIAAQGTAETLTLTVSGGGDGTILSGHIPPNGGYGLIVFAGGTFEQLIEESGCAASAVTFWTTDADGRIVQYLPGVDIPAVNADFQEAFPSGRIDPLTPLLGRCQAGGAGVFGTVTIGPVVPALVPTDPPELPYAATLVVRNETGAEVTRTRSSALGHYRVALAPGRYRIDPLTPAGQEFPAATPVEVVVPAGEWMRVDVAYDSGIRTLDPPLPTPQADATP